MKELVAIAIALSALFAGTITDIKKREVPDWLNYGLMFTGFALSGMASILYFEPGYILESIAGFLFFFILGTLLFYTGQWGGGDTKMLMGLGALIGLQIQIPANLNQIPFLIVFLVCTLIAGAAYGLVWTIYMGIKKRKTFSKNLKKKLTEKRIVYIKYALLIVMALLFALAVTAKEMRFIFLLLALAFPLLFYLSVFIKIIEKECMIKKISPDKLTEGDWIEEEIMENKKKVCPKKILTRKDIEKINKIKNEHTAEIKRKYLFFWIKKTVDISEIKNGDILCKPIQKPIKLNPGKIKKDDAEKLVYKFSTPKVKKKFLIFKTIAEFDENSIKEGDELLCELYFGEYISGPKDLGISKENIQKLLNYHSQGKIKEVTIKEGIPFVPSFLIAFIMALFL